MTDIVWIWSLNNNLYWQSPENTRDEAYLDDKVANVKKDSLDCHVAQPCLSDHNEQYTCMNLALESDNKHFVSNTK